MSLLANLKGLPWEVFFLDFIDILRNILSFFEIFWIILENTWAAVSLEIECTVLQAQQMH